jgi:thioredoxin 1
MQEKNKAVGRKNIFQIIIILAIVASGCGNRKNNSDEAKGYRVTFIELGSVKCIPCQKMQAVMKSVEQKYSRDVKVIFYDVWTPEGKPFGDKYKISVIPVQVFLDSKGKEYFRHEGYFPEEELVKVLEQGGAKVN